MHCASPSIYPFLNLNFIFTAINQIPASQLPTNRELIICISHDLFRNERDLASLIKGNCEGLQRFFFFFLSYSFHRNCATSILVSTTSIEHFSPAEVSTTLKTGFYHTSINVFNTTCTSSTTATTIIKGWEGAFNLF